MKNITLYKIIICVLLTNFSKGICSDIVCPRFGEIKKAIGHKMGALDLLLKDLERQGYAVTDKRNAHNQFLIQHQVCLQIVDKSDQDQKLSELYENIVTLENSLLKLQTEGCP